MICSIENREERLLDFVAGSLETEEAAQFENTWRSAPRAANSWQGSNRFGKRSIFLSPRPYRPPSTAAFTSASRKPRGGTA